MQQRASSSRLLSRRVAAQLARNQSLASSSTTTLSHSSSADSFVDAINSYCEKHSTVESTTLANLRAETVAGYPPNVSRMISGPLQGALLKALVSISRAENILELGTFTGYAAIAMAEGIADGGKVFTCDIDTQAASIALKYVNDSDHLRDRIEFHPIAASDMISRMRDQERRFDMVFVDADKKRYQSYILDLAGYKKGEGEHYHKVALSLLKHNAIILVDNTLWKGLVLAHVSLQV